MGEADSENFDRWVEHTFGDEIDKTLLTRVAGVAFDNEDGSSRQTLIQQCRKYQRLNLVAEPKNKYDPAAVRVETKTGKCLGYVPRNFNLPFGPDRWLAVVRDVHFAEPGKMASLVIGVLRKAAEETALPESSQWFETQFRSQADRYYLWGIERYAGVNSDGSDRQALIEGVCRGDLLELIPETENGRKPDAVSVCNAASQTLGYLGAQRSRWLASEMRAGRTWRSVAYEKLSTPGGKRHFLQIFCFRLREVSGVGDSRMVAKGNPPPITVCNARREAEGIMKKWTVLVLIVLLSLGAWAAWDLSGTQKRQAEASRQWKALDSDMFEMALDPEMKLAEAHGSIAYGGMLGHRVYFEFPRTRKRVDSGDVALLGALHKCAQKSDVPTSDRGEFWMANTQCVQLASR